MNYTIAVSLKISHGVVPLAVVADVMARADATSHGELPFHQPTYDSARKLHGSDLLKAARSGRLVVCNERGANATVDEIIREAEESGCGTVLDAHKVVDLEATHLLQIYTTAYGLNEWRKHTGDTFQFVDRPVQMIEWDLKNLDGVVIEPRYFRGFVGVGDWSQTSKDAISANDATAKETSPRVYWRVVLSDNIRTIDERSKKGKASVREVIAALRRLNDKRLPDRGGVDELVWLDDSDTERRVMKKTVSTAISDARKLLA